MVPTALDEDAVAIFQRRGLHERDGIGRLIDLAGATHFVEELWCSWSVEEVFILAV